MSGQAAHHDGGYVPPGTGAERGLVAIWEEILGQGPIGIEDDFFVSGGDSVKAIHVMFRIEERFGARIAVTEMFSQP
jgi:acyl carrier protein